MKKPPFLTGCCQRRLDANRRIRLPTAWCIESDQTWLLFPRHIVSPCDQISHSLYLLPVDANALRAIISTSPAHKTFALTVDVVLDVLHAHARNHTLDPSVATVVRTSSTTTRFTLTKAQVEWLKCRSRTLALVGSLNSAWICTPKTWASQIKRAS